MMNNAEVFSSLFFALFCLRNISNELCEYVFLIFNLMKSSGGSNSVNQIHAGSERLYAGLLSLRKTAFSITWGDAMFVYLYMHIDTIVTCAGWQQSFNFEMFVEHVKRTQSESAPNIQQFSSV